MDPTLLLLAAGAGALFIYSKRPQIENPLKLLHENIVAQSAIKLGKNIKRDTTLIASALDIGRVTTTPVIHKIPIQEVSSLPIKQANVNTHLDHHPSKASNPSPGFDVGKNPTKSKIIRTMK